MYAPPSEFSKFDIHRDFLPEAIRPKIKVNLFYLDRELHEKLNNISTISDVVALPFGRDWKYKSSEQGTNLIVSGSFRSEYRAIVSMAEVLEEFYAEKIFLPRIIPVRKREWENQLEKKSGLFRSISMKGITCYSEHLHYG
jgi:hypothetical protein